MVWFHQFAALHQLHFRVRRAELTNRIRNNTTSENRTDKSRKTTKQETDVTMTLLVVVFVFVVCQLGNAVSRLLGVTNTFPVPCSNFYHYWFPIGDFLLVVNSSVNFIIYCLFGREFRRQVKVLLKQKFRCCVKIEEPGIVNSGFDLTNTSNTTQPSENYI